MFKVLSSVAALTVLTVFAFCSDIPKNAYDGVENKVQKFSGELFLMPEQKEALDVLTRRLKDKQKSLKTKISEIERQKSKALFEKNFAKAKESAAKKSAYETELENARIDYMKALTVILSDDEYDRLNETIADEAAKKQKKRKTGR
jgi:hypothetical protein